MRGSSFKYRCTGQMWSCVKIYFYFQICLEIGWWKESLIRNKSAFLQIGKEFWTELCIYSEVGMTLVGRWARRLWMYNLCMGRIRNPQLAGVWLWAVVRASGSTLAYQYQLSARNTWCFATQLMGLFHNTCLSLEEGAFSCFQTSWMRGSFLITHTLFFFFFNIYSP